MTAALTGDDHLVVHHDEPELSSRQKNLILTAMCVALIAVMAAVSGLNSAQMKISESLGASTGDFLWIANAYTLALAALLMPVGAIGDRWSRRKVLLLGLTVYLVSNVVGAFAGSVAMLIGARAIAGVGAAMIMPVTLSVITSTFHGDERQRAIGIWSGFAGAGAIFGMFISSLIVDNASWRWVFIMPIALAVIAFALSARLVPDGADHHGGRSTMSVRCCRRSPSAAWCSESTRAPRRAGPPRSPSSHWWSAPSQRWPSCSTSANTRTRC